MVIKEPYLYPWTFLVAQVVKNLPSMWENQILSLDWEDNLEKRMTTHSSILAGKFHRQKSLVDYSPWFVKVTKSLPSLGYIGFSCFREKWLQKWIIWFWNLDIIYINSKHFKSLKFFSTDFFFKYKCFMWIP